MYVREEGTHSDKVVQEVVHVWGALRGLQACLAFLVCRTSGRPKGGQEPACPLGPLPGLARAWPITVCDSKGRRVNRRPSVVLAGQSSDHEQGFGLRQVLNPRPELVTTRPPGGSGMQRRSRLLKLHDDKPSTGSKFGMTARVGTVGTVRCPRCETRLVFEPPAFLAHSRRGTVRAACIFCVACLGAGLASHSSCGRFAFTAVE